MDIESIRMYCISKKAHALWGEWNGKYEAVEVGGAGGGGGAS